jgi:membrane-associated phospholipid phosphatase
MRKLFFSLLICLIAAAADCKAFMPAHPREGAGKFLRRDSTLSLSARQGYVPTLFHNFGEQLASPVRMKAKDWIWTAGVAAVTALLIRYDHEIDEGVRYSKDKSKFINSTSPVVTEFGNAYGLGVVGACVVIGLAAEDQKLFQTSLMASQAAITSGVWVRLVKYCTSRERPSASYTSDANKGHPGGYWYGFFSQYDASVTSIGRDITFFDAFPSGHTSTAFAIASVFAMQYSETKAVPVLAYSLAGIVGVTRMVEHTHWASDVFVGAWAGFLCAKQVVLHHRKIFSIGRVSSFALKRKALTYLTAADNFPGLKLKMVF